MKICRLSYDSAFVVLALFLSACASQPAMETNTPLQVSDDISVADEPVIEGLQPDIPVPEQPLSEQLLAEPVSPVPVYNAADVVWIQQRLQELGYYAGAVDGTVGKATQGAIREYQTDQGMAEDGRPTAELREFMWRNGG